MTERDLPNLSLAALSSRDVQSLADVGNHAKWMHERLMRQIAEFEASLNSEEEVGARLVSAAGEPPFHIENVSYWGPDMLMFQGKNADGRPVMLLQHYTQLSVLLVAMRKQRAEPRRIGFMPEEDRPKGRP
jgi:hypothetical protein